MANNLKIHQDTTCFLLRINPKEITSCGEPDSLCAGALELFESSQWCGMRLVLFLRLGLTV